MEGTHLGPYHILSELGSGGMGKVYRAELTREAAGLAVGTAVAIKVIHTHRLEQEGLFQRFLREAEIGRSVRHENVVKTYVADAMLSEGVQQNFLVMEYVEGQTLRNLLRELDRVPEELCRHIGREVAQGLAAIHAGGVVHRDLKPENVLITPEHVVKVMDLGVAKLQDAAIRLSQAGVFVGSLEYAAPEQFRSADAEPDGRSDLHALGVMLYELATGQHPYRDEDASRVMSNILQAMPRQAGEVNPQLSPFFEDVVHTLMAKDREHRFETASLLASVLEDGEKSEWWEQRARTLRVATRRPLRRIRIPRETALYGRDDGLAKLRALFEAAKAGDGRVLLIEGEAGIGKTRLMDEFVGRLHQAGEDINFLFGSYPPGGAATASGAFAEAYREQFGAEGLRETLGRYLAATPILVPAFAAVLRGETTPAGAEPLTKDSLQTVFVHSTRGLAAERTTVVVIDDLHFAPEDGRSLFASLALAVPGQRVLLVGTMRPGVPEDWIADLERLDHAERTVLARLGTKDLFGLLKDSFRSERLAQELGMQIGLKCDGNPFFAFEIIRGLREGQFLSQRPDGTWVTTQVIEDIQVPSSVLDLVNARVADLSEEDRDLLDVAACYGYEFDPLIVGAAVGLETVPALKRLAFVERKHHLVRAKGARYVFDHHQVHEALFASLSEPLRKAYHGAIGRAMEPLVPAEPARWVRLCEHLLRGGEGARARPYLDEALRILKDAQDLGALVNLHRLALDAPRLLTGTERIDHLLDHHETLQMHGDADGERAALQEALALATSLGDDERAARATYFRGWHEFTRGNVEEAFHHAGEALERARRLQLPDIEMQAMGDLGTFHFRKGEMEEAETWMQRGIAMAREHRAERNLGAGLGNLGNLRLIQGHLVEALACYEEGIRHLRAAGHPVYAVGIQGATSAVAFMGGRLGDALHIRRAALQASEELGARRVACTNEGEIGRILAWLGDLGAARDSADRTVRLAAQVRDSTLRPFAEVVRGLTHEFDGDLEAAEAAYRDAMAGHHEVGNTYGLLGALCTLGSLRARRGDPEEARTMLEEARDRARGLHAPFAEVYAAGRLALLPGGDPDEARALIARRAASANWTDVLDLRNDLWLAERRHEDLLEAKRLLDHLVAHAPETYRETMLRNVPLNRQVMEAWEQHEAAQA